MKFSGIHTLDELIRTAVTDEERTEEAFYEEFLGNMKIIPDSAQGIGRFVPEERGLGESPDYAAELDDVSATVWISTWISKSHYMIKIYGKYNNDLRMFMQGEGFLAIVKHPDTYSDIINAMHLAIADGSNLPFAVVTKMVEAPTLMYDDIESELREKTNEDGSKDSLAYIKIKLHYN